MRVIGFPMQIERGKRFLTTHLIILYSRCNCSFSVRFDPFCANLCEKRKHTDKGRQFIQGFLGN